MLKNIEDICSTKLAATDILSTAGKPITIRLLTDQSSIDTDYDNVANIEVRLLDEHGTLVPGADRLVKFTQAGFKNPKPTPNAVMTFSMPNQNVTPMAKWSVPTGSPGS
jgi:hypothetical protein